MPPQRPTDARDDLPPLEITDFPTAVPLLDDKATCHIDVRTFTVSDREMPCWVFRTEGLAGKLGAHELFFVIRRPAEQDPHEVPAEPLVFLQTLVKHGERRALGLDAGTWHELGRPLFGRFDAVLYAPGRRHTSLPEARDALLLHLLTRAECETLGESGPLRVLAGLGRDIRYFPWPPWNDPGRDELRCPEARGASLLPMLPRIGAWRASVTLFGEARLVLKLPAELRDSLPAGAEDGKAEGEAAFALLTGLDASTDACLSWNGEVDQDPRAVARGASATKIGGCFLAIVADQEPEDRWRIVEDGFVLKLGQPSWARFKTAVATAAPLDIATEDEACFQLRWLRPIS